MQLGDDTEEDLLRQIAETVPSGAALHVHGSPPCTLLAQAQAPMRNYRGHTRDDDAKEGMRLVTWFMRFIVRLRPTSWSFEQVAAHEIDGALRLMQCLYPSLVGFEKRVNMKNYGLGQARIRTIAGSPWLIDAIRFDSELLAPAPLLSDLLEPPEGATLVMSSAGKKPSAEHTVQHADGSYTNASIYHSCFRQVDEIAFTVIANRGHSWARSDFTLIRMFTPRESATLQTFPEAFKMPKRINVGHTSVGNAVPPLFAQKLMSS